MNEINRKRTNSTNKPEQNTTTNKSTPNSVSTKGSAIIVGKTFGRSQNFKEKSCQDQNKSWSNNWRYYWLLPSIRKKSDFSACSFKNKLLKNGLGTLTKVRKVVTTVEEMVKEIKIESGFSSIIDWGDTEKTEKVVAINDKL